jgi:diguanylate cyclase (GGDEF)-like protein/PAS domain S-box-containing protein
MLQYAQANFAALIESTPDLIWSVDLDYRLISFNPALQQYIQKNYGVRLAEKMCFNEVLPPGQAKLWPVFYERILAEGPFRIECSRADGVFMELAFDPIAVDGDITGISIIGKDITQRKAAEDALHEAGEKYRNIFDGALKGIFQTTLEGRVLAANPAVAGMLGYDSPEDFISSVKDIAFDVWAFPNERTWYLQLLEETEELRGYEVQFKRKDGTRIWVRLSTRKTCAADGVTPINEGFIDDITEQKKSESALKKAEANLSALIESTQDLILSVDLDYRLITFNRASQQNVQKNYGVRLAAGMRFHEVLTPELAALWPGYYARVLAEGPFQVEYTRFDGGIMELTFNPIAIDGVTTGISIFGKDITERKAAEESRRFLAEVVESCEEAIITSTPSGDILSWNHGAEAIYGYSAGEVIGKPFFMIIAPERKESAARIIGQLLRGAPPLEDQGVGLRKDGSKVYVTVTTWPIRNSAGEVTAICTIVRDVSVHHEAENNRALLASVVESSGDLILAFNLDGTFASWNSGAERMTGYTSEEILGKNVSILIPSDREKELPKYLGIIRDGYTVSPVDVVMQRKDGSGIDVSLTMFPIRNPDGEVVGSAAIARDIRERKQSERALQEAEKRYRDIFEGALEGICQATLEGRLLSANSSLARIRGYDSPEELVSMAADLTQDVWVNREERTQYVRQLEEHGSIRGFECQLKRKDGRHIWASLNDRVVCGADGRFLYLEGFMEDITERKRAEKQLRDNEGRYRTFFQTHFDAINITRLDDGKMLDCNQAFLDLVGYEREEVLDRTTLELGIWADARDRQVMTKMVQRDSSFRGLEIQFRKKNGEVCWGEMAASVMEIDGVPCILNITRDISAAKTAEKTIRSLAFYDPLTGLPNRRMLMERLRHPLVASARSGHSQALLMIDMDHFKTLNDTLGHPRGDLMLKEAARRIVACAREADTVCRMGGDEFVVVLEELSKVAEEAAAQTQAVGEKILAAIEQPCLLDHHEYHSTASIGIAVFWDRQDSTDETLQQAEIALYQAKAAGRNTLRFFSPALQAAVNARATLEVDLRQGIKTKQFLLYYQPQVERGHLSGAEALIRWKHPGRGIVSPSEFIPLAEESRLILPLGEWVLEAACEQIALWAKREETAHLTVAVNISALQFRQSEFVEQVLATLSRTGAKPENLRLELTESMLVENIEDIIVKMNELKSHGLRFSLDDFGTGYSSLSYLKRLPLDRLKIDRSFVRDMLVDATSGAITQTILSLGRAMGVAVIAEGVETEEQRDYLAGLGCYSFQGFLFSPPLPLEQFEAFVRGFAETGSPS